MLSLVPNQVAVKRNRKGKPVKFWMLLSESVRAFRAFSAWNCWKSKIRGVRVETASSVTRKLVILQ
jgi:hypothetical protein